MAKQTAKAQRQVGKSQGKQSKETPPEDDGVDDEEEGSDDEEISDEEPESWEQILATLPKEHQDLYNQSVSKLKTTVKATRKERDRLQTSFKSLSDQLKDKPDLQKQVDDLNTQITSANRKADFMASAPSEGCKNPKAAYALALSEELFDSKGEVDWDDLRDLAPELFKKASGDDLPSGGGEGREKQARKKQPTTMNDLIRSRVKGGSVRLGK